MSRFFQKISMAEFKAKIQPLLEDDDEFPYNLPDQVQKDIKIEFDYENRKWEGDGYMNYPCGFETLPNGMSCLFVNAGGDWETPICYVIYFDGKKLRAYVPTKGNMWNRKEKCAFGSDSREVANYYFEKCKTILEEAQEWMDVSKWLNKLTVENASSIFHDIDVTNRDAIYKDIMERIVEK